MDIHGYINFDLDLLFELLYWAASEGYYLNRTQENHI